MATLTAIATGVLGIDGAIAATQGGGWGDIVLMGIAEWQHTTPFAGPHEPLWEAVFLILLISSIGGGLMWIALQD